MARKATVTASSEHSASYLAKFAVDGTIPEPFSAADPGQAWAVQGPTAGDQATFTLRWEEPVTAGEVVYYGRTAFLIEECWKDRKSVV